MAAVLILLLVLFLTGVVRIATDKHYDWPEKIVAILFLVFIMWLGISTLLGGM